jgi:ribonuclease P/MRP protein subunit POP5
MVNTKLKPILPSLREKKRYLVFEVISKEKVGDIRAVSEAINSHSLQFMGHLEAAKAGILVLGNKWDSSSQRGIIRVGHRHVDQLKASLAFIVKINNSEVIFRSLGVSGIVKKAENNYLKAAG